MASRDLKGEVIDLVANERGLARERVQLSDRLLQDLGMDGDDAVDFFKSVHERFGTDFTHLGEHWSSHFGPEGVSCLTVLVLVPAVLIGGAIAGFAGLPTFWSAVLLVALLAATLWAYWR